MRGKITKGIAGFYYVHSAVDGYVYECKARGLFRKDKRKPLVGDDVEFDVVNTENREGNIVDLLPRSSVLIRPAVANIHQALIIFSICHPQPNFNLLDRFLIMMGQQGLPCIVCFNKEDLGGEEGAKYEKIYRDCGYTTLCVSAKAHRGLERLEELLKGKTTAVAGPSGVGKSSLINCLQTNVVMETGGISEKIQRGKHTTRHSELIAVAADTYILDTPGFSSLELFSLEKEELAGYYPEFAAFESACKFGGCAHMEEPVCGIRDAVAQGKISSMRYENYRLFYEELKNRKKY